MRKSRIFAAFMSVILALNGLPIRAQEDNIDCVSDNEAVMEDTLIDEGENENYISEEAGGEVIKYTVKFGQTEARKMLSRINDFRKSDQAWYWNKTDTEKVKVSGLADLKYDYGLEKVAMIRAAEIAKKFAHTRPNGKDCWSVWSDLGYTLSGGGENIAYGFSTEEAVFIAWREDNDKYAGQGHRRNMLSSSNLYIGIGHAVVNGTHYWTQDFGSAPTNVAETAAADKDYNVTVDTDGKTILESADGKEDPQPEYKGLKNPKEPDEPSDLPTGGNVGSLEYTVKDIRKSIDVKLDMDDGVPRVIVFCDAAGKCGYSAQALSDLGSLMDSYKQKLKAYVFDINSNSADAVKNYLESKNFNKSIFVGTKGMDKLKLYFAIRKKYAKEESYYMPLIAYIDGNGKIIAGSTGTVTKDAIKNNLDKLVKTKTESDEGIVSVNSIDLVTNEKYDLAAVIRSNAGREIKISKYKSANKNIATVSKKDSVKETTVSAYSADEYGYLSKVAQIKLKVYKPVFKFEKTDLTHAGQTVSANAFLRNVPEGKSVYFTTPASKYEIMRVSENKCTVIAGDKNGSVKVTAVIGEGENAAKYKAALKVKKPKLKENLSIKAGKSKKLTLKNVSSYNKEKIQWRIEGSAVSLNTTNKNNIVKLIANSPGTATVIATLDGVDYSTTVTVE